MSGLVDLSPPHLAIVEQILSEHVPDCEVRAFGSRATWTAKDYSDLDLAIVGDGPLDRRTLGRLQEAFEESTLPMRVDVVDLRSITDSFRESIELEAVLLKGKEVKRVADRDWRTARWGELATLEYGKSLRDYDNHGDRYKVYGTNGPIGWHSKPLCPYASVIIGRKGAYRGIHYSAEPFFVIDTAFYLKPLVEFDTKWAYYQLLTQDINRLDSGSAIPSTSREDFYSLSVKVPSLEEQRAIARILGTLDDKIELNRHMSETLDEMARALFRSWFVDFDPVRAKAEGRPSGLPPDLDALFPESFESSEIGEIPTGWTVLPAGDAVSVRGGTTPRTNVSAYWNGEHCFATPRELSQLQHPVLSSTSRHLTDAGVARIGSGILPTGTVLLSSRAPIGYIAIADIPVAINQGIIAMVCLKTVDSPYVLHWVRSNMATITSHASGTTFAEISKSSFREIPFLVPSEATHRRLGLARFAILWPRRITGPRVEQPPFATRHSASQASLR